MNHVGSTSKITANHTTVTAAAKIIVQAAHELADVTKITLGVIKHIGGGGKKRLKFLPIIGGTMAVVRGSGAVQEIYIYTANVTATQEHLSKTFNN